MSLSYCSPNQNAVITEFFNGQTDEEVQTKMDERRRELEPHGATGFRRAKIGCNATCLCGSGLKFKKCCLRLAR